MKEGKTTVQISAAEVRALYNQLIATGHAPKVALQNAVSACAYWAVALSDGERIDTKLDTLPLGSPQFRLTLGFDTGMFGDGVDVEIVPFDKAT